MNRILDINHITFISSKSPFQNYGGSNQVYAFSNDNQYRTLIWFYVSQKLIDFNNEPNTKVIIRLYNSMMRPKNDAFELQCSPILKSWVEGLGSVYNDISGVNWVSTGGTDGDWDNEGGDFNESIQYNVSINKENFYTEIDVSEYITQIEMGAENYGIMLYSNQKAHNFSFYSNMDQSGFQPMLIQFDDTYEIDPNTTAQEFNGEFPVRFKFLRDKYDFEQGDIIISHINVIEQYRRDHLFTPVKDIFYLPNVKFKLVDELRGKVIYDYSEYTKVPIRSHGMMLSIITNNLPKSVYYVVLKYEDEENEIYSHRETFRIV